MALRYDIRVDAEIGPEAEALMREHLAFVRRVSPRESIHALDLEALRSPALTFWGVWHDDAMVGCGALAQLDARHGEIKSMRTASRCQRRGIGRLMLEHLIATASARGYARLSLETGVQAAFEPARKLYARHGFVVCGPFADYAEDPSSVFMTRTLP